MSNRDRVEIERELRRLRGLARLEEPDESWEYGVSDILVQGAYLLDGDFYAEVPATENYTGSRFWMELHLCRAFRGQHVDYFADVRHSHVHNIGAVEVGLEINHAVRKGYGHVLGDVAEFIDLPEGIIFVGQSSVVRLERLNLISGCWWDFFHSLTEARIGSLFSRARIEAPGTRELGSWEGGLRSKEAELPHEVIKGRSQSEEHVTGDQAEAIRWHREFHVDDVEAVCRIHLYGDFGGVTRMEHPEFGFKAVEMFLRPDQFQDRVF